MSKSNFQTKLLSLLLVTALIITIVPMNVFASETTGETDILSEMEVVASGDCGENVTWMLGKDGVLTISGSGAMEDYEAYNSAPWYDYIKKNYSSSTTSATKVIINEGVTSIGSYAFSYCNCTIQLPNTITSVHPYAFYHAFKYMEGYTLILPNGLVSIGQYAFYNSGITDINFPSSLKTIGKNAFYGCSKLKEVELNDGIESILNYAFSGCTSLEKVIIPSSITTIPDCCFTNCSSLLEIEIPDSVTSIQYRAFGGCSSLEFIELPCNLTYISRYLFYECSNLKQIVIPDTVKSIGWHAFDGCSKLKDVKLNESLKWIESSAFYNCYDLKIVVVPSTTTSYESSTTFGYVDDSVTGESDQKVEDFTLYCWKGSEAEANAVKYGTNYKTIELELEERCLYTGSQTIPTLEIRVGDKVLQENKDYIIDCMNNDAIGTANIKISFMENYSFLPGIERTYEICKDISEWKITLDKEIYQYHTLLPIITIKEGEDALVYGTDYEIYYTLSGETWKKTSASASRYLWNVGECEIKIVGLNQYVGEEKLSVEVHKFDLSKAKLMTRWTSNGDGTSSSSGFDMQSYEYDGIEKTQNGYRVCDDHDTISSDNYEVSYKDNVNPGTATMIITGKGDYYTGTLEKKFEIYHNHTYKTVLTKATTSNHGVSKQVCSVCGDVASTTSIYKISSVTLSTSAYTYDGKTKSPSVTVKDSKGNKLTKGKDYTVTYSSSSRSTIGRYSVKVAFKGEYSGSKTLYFTIGPKNPSSVSAKLYDYDDVKVSWKKVSGATGYVVYYKKSTASSWSSKRTTGTSVKLANLADGVKYDIKVVTYKTKNGCMCYNAGKTTSVYTLKKVTGVKVAKSGSKVKVSWANISDETGYQISKSSKKSGTSVVATYKTTSGKSKIISATKGKTYYYKVRAYKVVDGKKIYGPWSAPVKYVRK